MAKDAKKGTKLNYRELFLSRAGVYFQGDEIKKIASSLVLGHRAISLKQAYSLEGLINEPLYISKEALGEGVNDWDNFTKKQKIEYLQNLPADKRQKIIDDNFGARMSVALNDSVNILHQNYKEIMFQNEKPVEGLESLVFEEDIDKFVPEEFLPVYSVYKLLAETDALVKKVEAGKKLSKDEVKLIEPQMSAIQNARELKYKEVLASEKKYSQETIEAISKVASVIVKEITQEDIKIGILGYKESVESSLRKMVGEKKDYIDVIRGVMADAIYGMLSSGKPEEEKKAVKYAFYILNSKKEDKK